MAKFTFIDLFAGIGGFRLGLSHNGGKCLAFSEINKSAIAAYCDNYKESKDHNLGDIRKIKDLPHHDLLTGGVPCQSWSIAGKNLGLDDDRGQLWNDTIYLLNKSRPKAFIFENVKGLIDPRNAEAFQYILERIRLAGYHAKPFVINSYDYSVPQNRVRVYIIGFLRKEHMDRFVLPEKQAHTAKLFDFLDLPSSTEAKIKLEPSGQTIRGFTGRTRFQKQDELNDFFLFNDIRNGHSTVHSWDIIETSEREKEICLLLLANRRKKVYGPFDGNPLALRHFQELDGSITREEITTLVKKGILKTVEYIYQIHDFDTAQLRPGEEAALKLANGDQLRFDLVKNSAEIKKAKLSYKKVLEGLKTRGIISCIETRYEFRYSKISAGINGVNRIYLPISDVYSTLVASDTHDYVATINVSGTSPEDFKERFLKEVFLKKAYRKITKEEACVIQGYPREFKLPEQRDKWMKLLGNSVSVPVIDEICKAIVDTGVFDKLLAQKPAPQIKLDFSSPLHLQTAEH